MNLIKNRIQKNFTMIPNELIEDKGISDRGRFLFVYMASKPNDWEFFNKQLCKALGYGEDTLRKYMKELENNGWLTRYTKVRERGKFTSNIYAINEAPENNDVIKRTSWSRKNSDTENTVSEKNRDSTFPRYTNTNYTPKRRINKKEFNRSKEDKISQNLNPRQKIK